MIKSNQRAEKKATYKSHLETVIIISSEDEEEEARHNEKLDKKKRNKNNKKKRVHSLTSVLTARSKVNFLNSDDPFSVYSTTKNRIYQFGFANISYVYWNSVSFCTAGLWGCN